jgi:hypothetical protein
VEVRSLIFAPDGAREKWMEPNPNAPIIDPASSGVGNAMVSLRGVSPERSRPWDHPPVRVEQRDRRFHIYQGENAVRYGVVRVSDSIEMVSRDPFLHVLHARGAAYFSLAFPDPDRPRIRTVSRPGRVELTSAAGYFAMRAWLFVDDHPYYAQTDASGRFTLENVPSGRYEVVGWMPNWLESSRDREPESGVVSRLYFGPPAEKSAEVLVQAKTETELNLTFSVKDFHP